MTRMLRRPRRQAMVMTERLAQRAADLPVYQMRTCARCGRRTTFVLQDPAGWYSCLECGRYA